MDKVLQARYRRKIRIEKIRALRSNKPEQLSNKNELNNFVSIPIEFLLPQKDEDIQSNMKNVSKDRKVRNRESAFNSRKRKSEEMMQLQQRVHSLEDEVQFLRQRLKQYEPLPVTVIDTMNSAASSTTSTTTSTTTTTLRGKISNMIPTSNVDSKYIIQQHQYSNCNSSLEPAVFKI